MTICKDDIIKACEFGIDGMSDTAHNKDNPIIYSTSDRTPNFNDYALRSTVILNNGKPETYNHYVVIMTEDEYVEYISNKRKDKHNG